MSLLINKRNPTAIPGQIALDLALAMERIEQRQTKSMQDTAMSAADYRAWFDDYTGVISSREERAQVETRDTMVSVDGLDTGLRIYEPPQPQSVIVFIHGGGWIMGSIETHDHQCRWLAVNTSSRVISIEYGLAPERPYPFAVNQVAGVVKTIMTTAELHGDMPIFVAGDSAGANIAAMAILELPRPDREKLTAFISIYGAYSPHMNLSSHKLFKDGTYGLSKQQMQFFWNLYAPHISLEDRSQITVLGRQIDFFPPTLCIGVEYDLLLDDTLSFYSDLASIGADVTLSLWPGLTHGVLHFLGIVDSVTTSAQTIVQFVAARRGGDERGSDNPSIGRLLTEPRYRSMVQLPMLEQEQRVSVGKTLAITAPHLIPRGRLHGSLTYRLGNEIISGKYPPGELLPSEDEVAPDRAVSRNAYREAIRTLAAKGLVVATPKVGTKVAPRDNWRVLDPDVLAWQLESTLDEDFLKSLFEMRKVVEPSAAALCAVRLTKATRAEFADALSKLTHNVLYDPAWISAMLKFHRLLLEGSGNFLLAGLWPSFDVGLRWLANLHAVYGEEGRMRDPVGDYAMVFDKLASQDAEASMIHAAYLIDEALADAASILQRLAAG